MIVKRLRAARVRLSPVVTALALVLLVALTVESQSPRRFSFYREDLEFRIVDVETDSLGGLSAALELEGIYSFRHGSEETKTRAIMYPFPRDSLNGSVEWIEAATLPGPVPAPAAMLDSSCARISCTIQPEQDLLLRIAYRQRMQGGQITYILTTTQGWGVPLEEANFILHVPPGVCVDSTSYVPDYCETNDLGLHCFWRNKSFWPEWDFVVWYSLEGAD